MKLANRIFLFFGALSVISFVQFNAMGVEGCNSVDAGRYCLKKNDKYACPAGCWCEKKTKVLAVADISGLPSDKAVRYACATKDPLKESDLVTRGVHYCPDGKTSSNNDTTGAKKEADCKDGETAYDGTNNCISETSGRYCSSKGTQYDCPKGCYCTGSKNAVGTQWWNSNSGAWETIPVTSWCNNNSGWLDEYLAKRGIHYCPEDFPNSDKKQSSEKKCYFETNDNEKVYADKHVLVKPGYFLPRSSVTESQCSAGSYCPGGELRPSAKKDVGIYQCPSGYRDGDAGAQSFNECENSNGERYHIDGSVFREVITPCPAGQYLDTTASSSRFARVQCVQCEPGYFCPDGIKHERCSGLRQYSSAGQKACSTCPMAQRANLDHTGCITAPVLSTSEEVALQQIDPNNLVALQWTVDTGGSTGGGTGEDTGNGTGGSTGGGTGGSTGNGTGEDTGNGTGGSTGGGTGGSTGGGTGEDTGNGTGGSTGGGTGEDTGNGTGGSTGNGTGEDTGNGTSGSTGDDLETPVSCTDAGKYWNGNVCTECPAGWYCPGNGQHYKCPFGGASTQNKASCVLNLNETQMEYNKCWLRYWNNAAAYRKCLYGIDLATLPH